MGQKIHPMGFRLGITRNHQSQWFVNSLFYPSLLTEDYFIRKELFDQFSNIGIANIDIHRKFNDQVQIIIHSSVPHAAGSCRSGSSPPPDLDTSAAVST